MTENEIADQAGNDEVTRIDSPSCSFPRHQYLVEPGDSVFFHLAGVEEFIVVLTPTVHFALLGDELQGTTIIVFYEAPCSHHF